MNKLVHFVEARKQVAVHRPAVLQTLWRHHRLYAGMSAAAGLLIAFLFLHVAHRPPDVLQAAFITHYSSPAGALAEDETLIKMLKEIKCPNQLGLSVKPLGWDVKPPRPCGWGVRINGLKFEVVSKDEPLTGYSGMKTEPVNLDFTK